VRIGLKGIDLVDHTDWPVIQKYGLTPSMTPGAGTIPDAFNRLDNHERLVKEMQENIARAAAAGRAERDHILRQSQKACPMLKA